MNDLGDAFDQFREKLREDTGGRWTLVSSTIAVGVILMMLMWTVDLGTHARMKADAEVAELRGGLRGEPIDFEAATDLAHRLRDIGLRYGKVVILPVDVRGADGTPRRLILSSHRE
ncbi:MAG: hypothetical protein U0835_00625 [Isosphaeraceae bacterium]